MSTGVDKASPGHDAPRRASKAPKQRSRTPRGATTAKVLVVAGHSPTDPGAIGNSLIERDLNKALVAWIVKRLRAHGITTYTDLEAGNPNAGGEVAYSQKIQPALTYSQHHNSASVAARGYEIYKTGTSRGARFAKLLHDRQLAALRRLDATWVDRGVKEAKGTRAEYFVTASAGSSVLSEMGFLSSAKDAAVFKKATYIGSLGEATVRAIIDFGRAEKLWTIAYAPAPAATTYTAIAGRTQLYRGTVKSAAIAAVGGGIDRHASVLLKKG